MQGKARGQVVGQEKRGGQAGHAWEVLQSLGSMTLASYSEQRKSSRIGSRNDLVKTYGSLDVCGL